MQRFQSHTIRGPKTMWCYALGADNPKVAKMERLRTMEMVLAGEGPTWRCSKCKTPAK